MRQTFISRFSRTCMSSVLYHVGTCMCEAAEGKSHIYEGFEVHDCMHIYDI